MAASIITGSLLCLFLQDITPAQLGSIMFYGFYPADQQLAQILSGGGIISMFTVSVIIILSSAYAGIFEATGFLNTTQARLAQLGEKITPYGSILLTATITSMATCNQTLSSILTYQLHKDSADNMQQLALDLENIGKDISTRFLPIWSISGRWNAHEELFLQNVKWLEVLAVRGSFGIQGNVNEEQVPDMILTMGGMDNISEEYSSTLYKVPNDHLKWEKTQSYNLGINLVVLRTSAT